jgi:hypothetical protein
MEDLTMRFPHSGGFAGEGTFATEREGVTLQMVAQAILDLKQAPGWPHFEKAVHRLMAGCDLKTLSIQDEADLLRISTRQFYKKGLQDALALVDRQADLLQQLRHDTVQDSSD